jgi:hypothetical protein
MITDQNGEFTAPLENSTLYTISTGLAAISFSPILETGGALAARSPVTIAARRLVTPDEEPCRILIDGTPHVYFSSVNETDQTMTVPLFYTGINQIYSVTGEAVPTENFAPGTSGFSIPESYFKSGRTLTGVWRFLGRDVVVGPELEICTDQGVPGTCEALDPTKLRQPFEYTRKVIMRLTKQAVAAARNGKWKGTKGKFSMPFLSRGAAALATMEKAFRHSKSQNFVCEVTPMSCKLRRVPKQALANAFAKIFEGKVPRGLEDIARRGPLENAAFRRELRKLPNTYVTCE